ncbi:hypothetical protein VTN77DRAFT_3373 [Rasamsonia byssochlamydoides]|uniref:uncharacterized protein n=1 Tax=Rasamsonia byssochlamydoides TaxID=89139 RepID=UPI003742C2F9
MSYYRPDVSCGPSTSGSIHPPPDPASTASYQFPLQPLRNQQSRYEEPYSSRSHAPLEYRIPSRPLLPDHQLPSPATTSRQSSSSSSTYSAYQPDHGAWREHSFASMQMDHGTMGYQHSDWEISPQRPGAGGRLFASGREDSPERNMTPCHVASDQISNQKHRTTGPCIPLGFERLLHPQSPPPQMFPLSPQSSPPAAASRFRLHIRQQPIAGRACAAGEKGRRPIDPPPILQLLLVDFDPDSEADRLLLQDPRFAVGCLLYSVTRGQLVHCTHVVEPSAKVSAGRTTRDSNSTTQGQHQWRSVQMLSGRSYVSPFYVDKEPDPATAPAHPSSRTGDTVPASTTTPATFFVFADLSVRTAGVYRLKFRLMDWGRAMESGMSQPILAEVWSDPFRVYSSKDFPGMRKSTRLTERLRELGVKDLKTRKGKRRGKTRDESDVSE